MEQWLHTACFLGNVQGFFVCLFVGLFVKFKIMGKSLNVIVLHGDQKFCRVYFRDPGNEQVVQLN